MEYKVTEQARVNDMRQKSSPDRGKFLHHVFSAWDLRTLHAHMQAFFVNALFLKPDCSEPNILLMHKCFFNLLHYLR